MGSRAAAASRTRLASVAALALVLAVLLVPVEGYAQVTTIEGGATETVNGGGGGTQASPWNLPFHLVVGDTGDGTLTISNGGIVNVGDNDDLALGAGAGSTGTVNVTGAGSTLSVDDFIAIGADGTGTGTLALGNGGELETEGRLHIGHASGSTASVTLESGSTISSDNSVRVGHASGTTASLTIRGGSTATFADVLIDNAGTTEVAGSGSTLSATTGGAIGLRIEDGGTLAVRDGGAVDVATGASVGATGTMVIGGDSGDAATAAGSFSASALALDGTLVFNHTDTGHVFSTAISGAGALSAEAGTTILSANSTYSGGTSISSGATLQIGNDGTTGAIAGNVANSGTLAFERSDNLTYGNVVSGTGGLTQAGSGTLTLSGANTYTGTTSVTDGTLALGAADRISDASALNIGSGAAFGLAGFDETVASLAGAGTVALGAGTLTTSGAASTTFSGVVSGTGGLTKSGAGTLTLTGTNTYTGGTTIGGGTLRIGNGGTSGAIAGDVTNNGTLAFDRSDAVTYDGVISGTGGLTKSGAGTLTLSGNNTFGGGTTVDAGALVVTGTLGGVTLGAGTTLGGTGAIGALVANGRVAPGNSIGTMSSGSVTFNAGSTLATEIDAAGNADLLDVTGTATINGGAVEVTAAAGSYNDGQRYTIVQTTAGVTGTFDSAGFATGAGVDFFGLTLLYEGTDVVLRLNRTAQDFAGTTTNPTLLPVAQGLDDVEDSPTPGQSDMLQFLYGIGSGDELDEAYRQLSGTGLGGAAQNSMQGGQAALGALLGGPLGQGGGGGGPGFAAGNLVQLARAETSAIDVLAGGGYAATDRGAAPERAQFWVQGIGGYGERNGAGAASGQTRSYAGTVGGIGFPAGEDLSAGPVLSVFKGRTESDDDLMEADSTSTMVAGYTAWTPGRWTVNALLGGVRHHYESDRRVSFGGFQGTATGEHDGWQLLSEASATYDWTVGDVVVSPTAGMGISWLHEEDWQESGGGGANLAVAEAETWSAQPRAGVGVSREFALDGNMSLTLSGQALWIGQMGDRATTYTASFVGSSSTWSVPGLEEPEHSVALGLGGVIASSDDWSARLGYAGRFGEGAEEHGVLLGFKFAY